MSEQNSNEKPDFTVPGIVGTVILALVALVALFVFPPVAFGAALLVGIRIGQFAVGTGRSQQHVAASAITEKISDIKNARVVLAAGFVGSVCWFALRNTSWLSAPFVILTVVGVLAAIYLPVRAALAWQESSVERYWTREKWTQTLATVAGVQTSVIDNECKITQYPDGSLIVSPLAAKIAVKIGTADLETNLARVAPHMEIDPSSDHTALFLRPVTLERARERAASVSTNGRRGARLGDDRSTPPVQSGGSLSFGPEDIQ